MKIPADFFAKHTQAEFISIIVDNNLLSVSPIEHLDDMRRAFEAQGNDWADALGAVEAEIAGRCVDDVPYCMSADDIVEATPEYDAARTAIHAWDAAIAAVPSQWQPIESAPKNDTVILTDGGYYIAGYWQDGRGWLGGWSNDTMIMEVRLEPTHWMPLPSPPESAQ